MIAPVSAATPNALKLNTSNAKNTIEIESQPHHCELSIIVQSVLRKDRDHPDNGQRLNQLNTLLTNASTDELIDLVHTLPNSAFKQWVKEIQNNALPNSRLSADQRQRFFSVLARQLTCAQTFRWQSVMPESLQDEFSSAVAKHNNSDQTLPATKPGDLKIQQCSLFQLVNSINNSSQQWLLSPDKAYRPGKKIKSSPIAQPSPATDTTVKQTISDAINTIAPDASSAVKQQLINVYHNVQIQMAAVDTPGNQSQTLVTAIQQASNLFRQHGLGSLLPTNGDGWVYFTYNSDNLPAALSHLQRRKTASDRAFGHHEWSVGAALSSFPDTLLLKTAEQLLAQPFAMAKQIRNKLFDTERGFAVTPNIDNALLDLEQSLFTNGVTDTQSLFLTMQALDAQVTIQGSPGLTKTSNGETYISGQLLRFIGDNSKTNSAATNNWGWVSTANLSDELFIAAADQQRIDVLSNRLSEQGLTDLNITTRAIKALSGEGTDQQNHALVNQYLKLQRSIQLASGHPELESNLAENLIKMNYLVRQAGLPTVLPASNKQDHVRIRFDSASLPRELASLREIKSSNDREYGHSGWYIDVSVSSFPPSLLVKYAKSQLAAIPSAAATSNLSQIDRFEAHLVAHPIDIQIMRDSARPILSDTTAVGEPVLGELLQQFDSETSAPESKQEFRQLADTSYLVASSLLTDSATSMNQEQMQTLYNWINAGSLSQLGFKNSEVIVDHNDEEQTVSLGPYGNFGAAKLRFTQAWLGSDKEQRLEYLGIDNNRWLQAEPYLRTSINATVRARDIERAEFGLDDAVMLAIAGTATYVTGSLANGAVTGMFGAGGALAGTVSTATASYLGAAAGTAATGFSSTSTLTAGDIDESLKSGLMGAITEGLVKPANTLKGATRLVAQAVIGGVHSELNGKDYQEGVIASVAHSFGFGVANKLTHHVPEFIAGFAGKATEVAIRTGGDEKSMQRELELYVINFTTGQASSKLTAVTGEDYHFIANSLGDLANVVIQSRGDMGKIRKYLDSDQFYTRLANNLGEQVIADFGGKETFSAVLYGKITNIIVANRGDIDKISNNIEGLALSVVGEWAGHKFTSALGIQLGIELGIELGSEDRGELDRKPYSGIGQQVGDVAEALGSLTNIAITSGWDTTAINAYIHGPPAVALGKDGADVIPEHFGSADELLYSALESLTHSYVTHHGDMQAVAEDMARFILEETIDFSEQVKANKPLPIAKTDQ